MRLARDESGGVLVEAAIVLPLALFFLLALLQLALVQEARLLLEYAAYRAARTGSLWNADPERMAAGARLILGPTVCPTRFESVPCPPAAAPLLRAKAGAEALRLLSAAGGFPGLALEVEEPEGLPAVQELDFDRLAITDEERRHLLLELRLRYWLELKVPFADWLLWQAWRSVGARRLPISTRIAVEAAAAGGHYFVPLATTHTMRMQSNRYPAEASP